MKTVVISRYKEDERQTLGILKIFADETKSREVFKSRTLELPWRDNRSGISCIPKGEYICRWTYSPVFKRRMYEVLGVPGGRLGIRMHSANFTRQLRGCIAQGSEHKDIDIDGIQDVAHSGDTMRQFEALMNKEDFKLQII